jgi:hypothetical protein
MKSLGLSVPVVVGPWHGSDRVRRQTVGLRAKKEKTNPS